jgi:hypothetical protein
MHNTFKVANVEHFENSLSTFQECNFSDPQVLDVRAKRPNRNPSFPQNYFPEQR